MIPLFGITVPSDFINDKSPFEFPTKVTLNVSLLYIDVIKSAFNPSIELIVEISFVVVFFENIAFSVAAKNDDDDCVISFIPLYEK